MRRTEWANDLLDACGLPANPETVLAVVAWCESERSHNLPPDGAPWNPLDTEEPGFGGTDWSSAGVKSYPTLTDGIDATKATLFNGRYGRVVSAFQLSNNANAICQAVSQSPWGSHPTDAMVNAIRADRSRYDVDIAPADGAPAPSPPPESHPPFPLPVGDWFGLPSPNPHVHSGQRITPWQHRMVQRGWRLTADGRFDVPTYRVCMMFQREKGLTVDGKVGPQTWDAAWTAPVT